MPIGSLTSQLFANIYLNRLDHFCKDYLQIKHYVRYVDDIVIFNHNKQLLRGLLEQIVDFSKNTLALELNPRKIEVSPTCKGLDFLGYRIYKYKILLRKRTQRKVRDAIQSNNKRSATSYFGLVKYSNSHIAQQQPVPKIHMLHFAKDMAILMCTFSTMIDYTFKT